MDHLTSLSSKSSSRSPKTNPVQAIDNDSNNIDIKAKIMPLIIL